MAPEFVVDISKLNFSDRIFKLRVLGFHSIREFSVSVYKKMLKPKNKFKQVYQKILSYSLRCTMYIEIIPSPKTLDIFLSPPPFAVTLVVPQGAAACWFRVNEDLV
jgi:hypothetical protein